jgi:GWxTD domain-containing protein
MKQSTISLALLSGLLLLQGCSLTRVDSHAEQRLGEALVGQPLYYVDYAGFDVSNDSLSRLEVYYQVFNFGLQFKQAESEYVADFVFTIRVRDGNGEQVKSVEQERSVKVPDYEATQSRFDYRTSQASFELPPGKYTVETTLRDVGSGQLINREFAVDLAKFGAGQAVASDLLFVQAAQTRSGEPGIFDKGELSVIPSVSRLYGGEDSTRLLFYFEIYRGADSAEQVNVETILRSATRGMLYRDTLYVELAQPITRQLREISMTEFSPGDYTLEVFLRGRRNKRLDQKEESFTIQWSQEALLKHDFNTAIEQLSYIAQSDEYEDMKKLQTMEEKVQAFNAFWDARDPTLGTPENESKREFYRRITFANRRFHHMRREGWRTDRGRIYIQFGEPDQIDDHPMSPEYPPYQIWHYYQEGRYRRFTFVDENEDSDFRLQYPYDGLNQRPDF